MGYLTYFSLDVKPSPEDTDAFDKMLTEKTGYYWSGLEIEEQVKWYSWPDDMRAISKEHPALTFFLNGDGEDRPDFWQAVFKNGELVEEKTGRVTFD